jgi:hypothetical protein
MEEHTAPRCQLLTNMLSFQELTAGSANVFDRMWVHPEHRIAALAQRANPRL